MRPINFRAKRKSTGEWLYGFLLTNRVRCRSYILTHEAFESRVSPWDDIDDFHLPEVIPETIGQDTGLRIIHNQPDGDTEITFVYEDDIIEELRKRWHDLPGSIPPRRYLVCWDEGSFCYKSIDGGSATSFNDCEFGIYLDEYKVIGNIHDNPELLKGK